MAVDKLVDSAQLNADLTTVANAIRTKGGTSAQLAFPSGFVSAVEAIPTGGGGLTADDIADGTLNFGDINLTVSSVKKYAFFRATGIGDVSSSTITTVNVSAFEESSATKFFLRNSVRLYQGAFSRSKAKYIVITGATTLEMTYTANNIADLLAVDWNLATILKNNTFNGCTSLNVLVLRNSTIRVLDAIGAFANTPFASGEAGGTLYVPQALISRYQSATNWSTILGYANNQIKSIESTHTDPTAPIDLTLYYADGTPIT